MRSKLLIFFNLSSFVILIGCSTNPPERTPSKKDCIYGKAEFDALNDILNLENKISIIRSGSIQMIPNYSVITFDPAYLDSSDIQIQYSLVGNPLDVQHSQKNNSMVIEPTATISYFRLKSEKIGRNKLDNSLKLYDHCNYVKYIEKFVKRGDKEGFGEGYGGNQYFIYFGKNKEFGVVDKHSKKQIKDYINKLFRQISVNEYIQTYSLEKDWSQFRDSVSYMFKNFDAVSLEKDFVIKDNWFDRN